MKQDVAPASRPLDAGAAALAVALCLSWGFNQVAIKLALPEIPPLIQAALRSTVGALIVVAWARSRGVKLMEPDGTLVPGIIAGLLFGLISRTRADRTTLTEALVEEEARA